MPTIDDITASYRSSLSGLIDSLTYTPPVQQRALPTLPLAPEQSRAARLQALDADALARTQRGQEYSPIVGWYGKDSPFLTRAIGGAHKGILGAGLGGFQQIEDLTGIPTGLGSLGRTVTTPAASRAAAAAGSLLGTFGWKGAQDFADSWIAGLNAEEQVRRGQDVKNLGETAGWWLTQGRGALQSLVGTLASSALGAVAGGPPGALAAPVLFQASQSAGDGMAEARRAGMSDSNAAMFGLFQGGTEGIITGLFNKIAPGAEGLLQPVVGKAVRSAWLPVVKEFGKQLLGELAEENVISALQNAGREVAIKQRPMPRSAGEVGEWALAVGKDIAETSAQTIITMGLVGGARVPGQIAANREAQRQAEWAPLGQQGPRQPSTLAGLGEGLVSPGLDEQAIDDAATRATAKASPEQWRAAIDKGEATSRRKFRKLAGFDLESSGMRQAVVQRIGERLSTETAVLAPELTQPQAPQQADAVDAPTPLEVTPQTIATAEAAPPPLTGEAREQAVAGMTPPPAPVPKKPRPFSDAGDPQFRVSTETWKKNPWLRRSGVKELINKIAADNELTTQELVDATKGERGALKLINDKIVERNRVRNEILDYFGARRLTPKRLQAMENRFEDYTNLKGRFDQIAEYAEEHYGAYLPPGKNRNNRLWDFLKEERRNKISLKKRSLSTLAEIEEVFQEAARMLLSGSPTFMPEETISREPGEAEREFFRDMPPGETLGMPRDVSATARRMAAESDQAKRATLAQDVAGDVLDRLERAAEPKTLGLPRLPNREESPIVAAMRKIEPAADRGAIVTARDLHKQGLTDAEILEAAKAGLIALHEHDYPMSLDAETRKRDTIHAPNIPARVERSIKGTFYAGAHIPQNQHDALGAPSSAIPSGSPLTRAPQRLLNQVPPMVEAITGVRQPTLRHGYFEQPGKQEGEYEPRQAVMRTKPGDLAAALHEGAHAILAFWMKQIKAGPQSLPVAFSGLPTIMSELKQLGMNRYKPGTMPVPVAGYEAEGFAEFLAFLADDPAYVQANAPETLKAWNELLITHKNPDAKRRVDRLMDAAHKWNKTESQLRAKKLQHPDPEPWTGDRVVAALAKGWLWAKDKLWNSLEVTKRFDVLGERRAKEFGTPAMKLKLQELTRYLAGHSAGVVNEFIRHGTTDIWGKRTGKSLMQAIGGLENAGQQKKEDFDTYLQNLTERDMLKQFPNRETATPKGEIDQNIERFEKQYRDFRDMADRVQAWIGRVNDYLRQSDEAAGKRVDEVEDNRKGHYVPAHRQRDDLEPWEGDQRFAFGGRGKNVSQYTGKFTPEATGSTRAWRPVLEQLMAMATERIGLGDRMRVVKKIIADSEQIPGMAEMVEELAVNKVNMDRAKNDKSVRMVDFVEPLAKDRKIKKGPKKGVIPAGTDVITTRLFRFDPMLLNMLENVGASEAAQLAKLTPLLRVGAKINKIVRFGAITANPAFVFAKGVWQDATAMLVKTKTIGKPGQKLAALVSSYLELLTYAVRGKRSKTVEFMQSQGVFHTSPYISERSAARELANFVEDGKRLSLARGWRVMGNAVEALHTLAASTQMTAQAAQIKLTAADLGVKDLSQATPEETMQIVNASKALAPFAEKGNFWRSAEAVPLLGVFASVPSVFLRSGAEAVASQPKVMAARAAMLGLGAIAYFLAVRDKEWWKDAPDAVKTGGLIFDPEDGGSPVYIPLNNHELQLSVGVPLAVLNAMEKEDPAKLGEFAWTWAKMQGPGINPAIEESIKQLSNRKMIGGRAELAPLPAAVDNWNEDTTQLARWIGTNLGIAPTRVDSALRGMTGGLATNVSRTLEVWGGSRRPEMADQPIVGGFIRRGTMNTLRSQGVKDEFYRLRDELEQIPEADRLRETPIQRKVRTTANNAAEALSSLAALARSADTLEERDRWDARATEVARQAVQAIKAGMPAPMLGRQASILQRERKRAGAR